MDGSLLKRGRRRALAEGALGGTLFGTAAILIRFLAVFSAFSIAFWRLVIASIILIAVVVASQKPFQIDLFRKDSRRIVVLGILLGTHFVLFASAVLDTTIINATVLVNTTPIWSMLVSSLAFKLKPSRLAAFGIILSIVGVSVITYADAASKTWTINLKGDSEAVLAAVVEAFYLNYGRETRRRLPIMPLMLTIYVVSAVTVFATGAAAGYQFIFPSEAGLALALVGLGILPTALAHSLYFSSLSHLKSFETATMALLEPVVATFLGVLLFVQFPAPLFVLGAALVLIGIV